MVGNRRVPFKQADFESFESKFWQKLHFASVDDRRYNVQVYFSELLKYITVRRQIVCAFH